MRLEVGEKLPFALEDFCAARRITAGTAEGLGALRDVSLGFFNLETKSYERAELPGSWELLNLWADVATYDDRLFAHTHVVLSGGDFVARGGHLFEGTVSVTGEIRLWTIDRPITRRMNPDIGLHLLDLEAAGGERA